MYLARLAITAASLAISTCCAPILRAQEPAAPSAAEIAAELSNPNTALASMTFKNQFRFFDGNLPNASDQWSYTFLFQPVFPFPQENGDKVIFRPAFPVLVDQPIYKPAKRDFETKSGLGDIAFDLIYAPDTGDTLLAGLGLISSLPTAANDLGTKRFTLGPEFLMGYMAPSQVAIFFPSHQWDVGGSGNIDVNLTTIQLGYTYLPGGGWNVGTAPIMIYDWNASQWTIPVNLNVGKTVTLQGKPWKLSVEVNYYTERNDAFANEWMVGFNVTPVVKNYFASMFAEMLR